MAEARLRGATGARAALEGVVALEAVAEGSRSEHLGPVLRTDAGNARVYIVGDNPFANEQLRALAGERVRVEGVWRNGVVRVEPGAVERLEGAPPATADDDGAATAAPPATAAPADAAAPARESSVSDATPQAIALLSAPPPTDDGDAS